MPKSKNDLIKSELADERLRNKMLHTLLGSGSWSMTYNEDGQRMSVTWSDEIRHALGFDGLYDYPDTFEAWAEHLHPDDKEQQINKVMDFFHKAKPGEVYDATYRMITKKGDVRWFKVVGDIIRWPNGGPRQFFGGCIDITARVKYDTVLREKVKSLEERIRQQEAAEYEKDVLPFGDKADVTSGMWSITLKEDKIDNVYWSRELRKMLGYKNEEDFPNAFDSLIEIVHPFDRKRVVEDFGASIEDWFGEKELNSEFRVLRNNGKYRWYQAKGNVKRRMVGNEGNFVGTLIDIHDEKEREIMRVEQERDNKIIRVLASEYRSVYYVDLKTEDLLPYSLNDDEEMAFGAVFRSGIKYSDAFRLSINKFVDPRDAEKMLVAGDKQNIIKALSKSMIFTMNFRNIAGRYCEMKIVKVNEETIPTAMVLAISDCDEQIRKNEEHNKRLEEERRKAESARVEKDIFIYNMSQDCYSLVNSMMTSLAGVKSSIGNSGKMLGYLDKVEAESKQLYQMMEDARGMSSLDRGQTVVYQNKVNFLDFAEAVVNARQDEALKKDVHLTFEIRQMVAPFVSLDDIHVSQILDNLLSNAIKYTPAKGLVLCVAEQERMEKNKKLITCRFVVEDTGIGMSDEFVGHIYELFSRERTGETAETGSIGLGMAVVKRLVDLLKGRINIETKQGRGTKVTVEFDCCTT